MSISYQHRVGFISLLGVLACGSAKVTAPPPPVVNGTLTFNLASCQAYQSAEFIADSVSLSIEPIVTGLAVKSYTIPSGQHSAVARVTKTGSTVGLWTLRNRVTVPPNGSVTANLVC